MSGFTKGPWHISMPTHTGRWAGFNTNGGTCVGIYATGEDLEAIALVPKDEILINSVQDNIANAKLIAAAPEMLEALQKAIAVITETDWDVVGYSEQQIQEWKELIKKATT